MATSIHLRFPATLDVFSLGMFRHEIAADGEADSAEDVLGRFEGELSRLVQKHDPLPIGLRIKITGCCRAHDRLLSDSIHWTNEIRSAALDLGGGKVWIEKVKFGTSPQRDVDPASHDEGPLAELVRFFEELRNDDVQLAGLAADLTEFKKKLPDDLQRREGGLRFDDPHWLRDVLNEVEPFLISRLHQEDSQ